jgi:hypothetical protein
LAVAKRGRLAVEELALVILSYGLSSGREDKGKRKEEGEV